MQQKPLSAKKVTEEEVNEHAANSTRKGSFKWRFEKDLFDGEWWAIQVPPNSVASALNSYRTQCESVYGTRGSAVRGNDGRLFLRRRVDEPVPARTHTKSKEAVE